MNDWKTNLKMAQAQISAEREAARIAEVKANAKRIDAKQRKRRQRTRQRIERGWTLSTGQTLRPIA